MTDKIKIAASILDENTELIPIPKKLQLNPDINIEQFSFIKNENLDDIEDLNNVFFSILEKYSINSFDLFNLKEISETLDLNITKEEYNEYDIDLLLYRVATNLNTALMINKSETENDIRLHLSDLENKFEILMKNIEDINKKISRIQKIKIKIIEENNIIKKYLVESNNLFLEKKKLENIDLKIQKVKKSILNNVETINNYIDTKLIRHKGQ